MTQALINGRIFTGEHLLEDHAVIIQGPRIKDVVPQAALPADVEVRHDLSGGTLLPGFIDLQVNGGGGVLFNDAPTVDTIRTIGAAHRQFGTTGFLPTLISDSADTMKAAIEAVRDAIAEGVPGVLGIHLEGPFINKARRGVHNPDTFRTIDEEAFELLTSLDLGRTLITIAPELTEPQMIRRLADAGVIVAAGHSAASYEETQQALAAGLSGFTHLYNAMTPLQSREPGVVGAALADTQSWCGIIVDGFHVHPGTLRVAHAAKSEGQLLLVTDAMPSVGSAEKSFSLYGETIVSVNGRCATKDDTLAGSDLDMIAAVRNTVELMELPWEEAVRMASSYPAKALGLDKTYGYIKPDYSASFVLVNDAFNVLETWIQGHKHT